MQIRLIRVNNDDIHQQAMALISQLMTAEDLDSVKLVDAQAAEVGAYEAKRWPLQAATKAEIAHYLAKP